MITKFKIFENRSLPEQRNNDIELNNKLWLIKGDINKIEKVLFKFMEKYNLNKKLFYWLNYIRSYPNLKGVYFGFQPDRENAQFCSVEKDENFSDMRKDWLFDSPSYIFQGELKIVDNQLFLDSVEADADKYNL